jgi:hypothetical protein
LTSIQYGQQNEANAIKEYVARNPGIVIEKCGIFLSTAYPYLGATPDGLIGSDGIVEVKCLPSVKDRKLLDVINDPASKDICLEEFMGQLRLKKQHNYYYQVQGQLQLSMKSYCIFIVYCENDFHSERIERDDEFWNLKMIPKLEQFFMECVLPEYADSRIARGKRVREPLYIVNAMKNAEEKKAGKRLKMS